MPRRSLFWIAIVLLLGAAGAAMASEHLPPLEKDARMQLERSPRHGEWVTIPASAGDKLDAWVVYPERKDRAPVVIVIHEIFGLTDWARAVADQLAAEGFLAVAPDFLSGKGPEGKGSASLSPDAARQLNSALQPAEVVARLNAVADWATGLPAATSRFGVVGYCWGGGISFRYATEQPRLGAAVVYYGVSPDTQALARVRAPVLGLYGGDDARVNATIPAAQEEMKRLGKRYDVEIYAGAGHAFLRQQDAREGANLRAAQSGWERTLRFFRETLSGGMSSLPAQVLPAALVESLCYCPEEELSAGVAAAGAAAGAATEATAPLLPAALD
jgi:carboxymethylenebutenolidase